MSQRFETNQRREAPQRPQAAPRAQYTLPRNANRAMQEMMVTIDKLRGALLEETAALKIADTKGFMALQDKKLDIARDYLEGMNQMIMRKDEMKKADPALLKKLEAVRAEFAEITYENHAAIERMKRGMKRLSERIMETAREAAKREEQLIYGANGHMQTASKGSIGLNESA